MNRPTHWKEVIDEDGTVRLEPIGDGTLMSDPLELGAAWTDRWQLRDEEGDVSVSTVFLPFDHAWSDDPNHAPVVYESMVFGLPDGDEPQERYCSREQAVEGHAALCRQYLGREPEGGPCSSTS